MRREKRGCRKKTAFPLILSSPTPSLQREHSRPVPLERVPEGNQDAGPLLWGAQRAGGLAAPKPGALTTGNRGLLPGKAKTSRHMPLFLDSNNPHLQVSKSWWMRRQKNEGFSVLRVRNEESPPFPHPYPRARAKDVASIPREGAGQLRGSLGMQHEDPSQRGEEGSWPLPSRSGECVCRLREVEGRRAAHRYMQ